ncbi:type II toxin-antitoxin system TacA family antitoxin [Xenorhabdus sp. KK7.4]|uniref:type II toxin-antitoxin system TacA family antitoxin n=1 Tax=Xenorhabdus sp. KK7.4 TaxID=1851572 RepID=UPI000C05595F|nr:DUF1778 domain-containing protein [Xenorhabdus sp. KK7.4]PHM58699.1 ABC transporter [Xenorhabdus sp. KK7.4]
MATISVTKPHKEVKNARVELKTSTELKETLRRAAQIAGVDLSVFILNAAFERAEEVLENQKRRELDEENWRTLNMLIAEPESPTLALRALMRKNKDGKATK